MTTAKKLYLLLISLICVSGANAQTEVRFYTTMGTFDVMLTDTLTPRTVDSFLARVADKYYDGTIFHRVIDNFMIQGGDPTGTGSGGPGYSFPDEFHPTLKNVPKALAMANSGPNTNGSQFFVNLVTNSHLNNKHTVFGMVTANFNIVQNIGKVPTSATDRPLTNVVLDSIRVTKFPTSVTNVYGAVQAKVYPNPTRGIFTIDLLETPTDITILNMAGQTIYAQTTKGKAIINLSQYPTGLYIIRLASTNGIAEHKLIVQ